MTPAKLNVLVIEDNPGDAFLIKFYLEESTSPVFTVAHAESVKDALDYLSKQKFDIILSDMNLPDSFGMDTLKTILGKYPGNLVIVLTGLTDEEVGLETVRYGAQDFLVKGKFDGKVLTSTVMFAFERFKLNRQLDNVSQELGVENWRLDSIQRLLKVGYFEIDVANDKIFRSDFALEIMGYGKDKQHHNFSENEPHIDKFEEMKSGLIKATQAKSTGEYVFKKNDTAKDYKVQYEFHDGKVCGVIREL